MEIEYKWEKPGGVQALAESGLLADMLVSAGAMHMHAVYYDSPDGLVHEAFGGLRVRHEGPESVCCLKLPAPGSRDAKRRQEYEVPAADIHEGLEKLPAAGAPEELCTALLERGVVVLCETEFDRRAAVVERSGFSAELAYDVGEMRRGGRVAPICEVELEFTGGEEEALHAFAAQLESELGLQQQPLSKLARAMCL